MTSKCEVEIDAIRIKLYEESKHLTREERIKKVNDKAQKLAEEFGFTIIPTASMASVNPKDTKNDA